MQKKSLKPLLLCVVFSVLFTMTACNSIISLTDLTAPTGLTVTDGVLHWNSVNAANAYVVNCDGVDVGTVTDVGYPLTGLTSGNTYVYKVKAKNTLGTYNDSPYSDPYTYEYVANAPTDGDPVPPGPSKPDLSPLSAPANIVINDGKISWDSVDNAESYIVSINGAEYTAAKNELTVSSLRDGVYNIKVKAVGDGKTYSSSEYCKEMSVDLYDGSVCTNEQFGNFKDLNQFESFLGYGFDVVADSIVSDRTVLTSFPIFNVDELLKMRFLKVNSKSSQVKIISEEKIENFIEQWNSALNVNVSTSFDYAKTVNVGGSVKLKNEYTVATNQAKSTHCYCITITDQKFYIVMQGDMSTYREMLSTGFEKDLYDPNIDPAVLFQRYGTHFITSAVMGGRMNAFYNMYSLSEETSIQHYAEVATTISTSFQNLFSSSFDLSTSISFSQNIETSKSDNKIKTKESVDVMGGGDFGIATIAQVPNVYADWQKSLDAYPSLMGIKDSSSLIGIWELIDINRDTEKKYTWIDSNGEEQSGTRTEQLQAYFYKYGLDNYNQLMSASSLPETVRPEAIGDNILVGGKEAGSNRYFTVGTDSINKISFTVLPDHAVGYRKTYSLSEESQPYAYMENDELVIRPASAIPSDTVIYLTIAAGDVQKTLRIKIIKQYNINYNLNFQSDYTVDSTLGVLEGSMLAPPSLMKKVVDGNTQETKIERFGYRLTGWANYQNGEYVPYDFSRPVASNLTLFAQWQKITNIVTFDAQGGNFENGQTALTAVIDYNEFAEQPATDPTRAHYIFQGWYERADGEIPFNFENTNILKKATVYAKWLPVQYTVTLQLNGGTLNQEKAYTSAEKELKITLNDPTKLYYDFAYWALADGTEIDLNNYLFLKDTTIKAVYTPTLYTVRFLTDGETEIPAQTASVDTGFLLPSFVPAPQKTGYTFITWQISKDGNVETVSNLNTLTVKTDITLIAVYELNKYTVSFITNGGNAIAPYTNVSHGVTVAAPTAPQKDDYKFAGWYKDETLEKRFLFEVDAITDNTVLYAAWTEEIINCTVTFFTNIPNKPFPPHKPFPPLTVAKNTLLGSRYTTDMNNEWEGRRFDGWFTEDTFENPFNAETTPITEDIALHANWVTSTSTVIFTDGERELDRKTYAFDEKITVPEDPEKEGYTFIGWSQDIPARMPARDLTINAIFVINSYTLTYYMEKNGEVYREKSFTFGEAVTLKPNDPQKTGHTFSGWDKEAPATMPAHDVSICGQWKKNSYSLTLYLTDSTDYYTEKFAEVEVEYDAVLADLTLPTPDSNIAPYGKRFENWNFGEFTKMPAHNIDATAIWDAITVNLTLHYGDETLKYTATYGKSLQPYLNVVPNTDRYVFDGTWQDENGYTVSEDAVVATSDSDLVLTANSRNEYLCIHRMMYFSRVPDSLPVVQYICSRAISKVLIILFYQNLAVP